ncbi:MAG: hypothetical protein KA166_00880 [Saprospiraceae bacterium]|nr:hypothetical protein [Saprospiraceae bacterium]
MAGISLLSYYTLLIDVAMKVFMVMMFFTVCVSQVSVAQLIFASENNQIEVLEQISFSKGVLYNEVVRGSDHPFVVLFKSYFNPASFETYKLFFLSSDWMGSSEEEFKTWQGHLKKNSLWLENILHVRDHQSLEFVIFQYTMETGEYILPSAAIFKKVNQSWKHISNVNDQQTPFLKSIGLLKPSYLTSMSTDPFLIERSRVSQSNERTAVEKFDRKKLFDSAKEVFSSIQVSPSDMAYAEDLFLKKAENEMVNYIAESYAVDPFDLMEKLNQAFGFSLFKFINTLKPR